MRPLETPRTVPASPRYTTIEDGGPHRPHTFRAPTFAGAGVARRVGGALETHWPLGSQGWMEEMAPILGVYVGLCWWHPDLDIEATPPRTDADRDAWIAWGDEVTGELLDQGYTVVDLWALYCAASELLNRCHAIVSAAVERRDFSSSPDQQAQPAEEPQDASAEEAA